MCEKIALRPLELLALAGDPALKHPTLHAVDLRVNHDLENRCKSWTRQAALGMRFCVRDIHVGRIEATCGLQIEAVSPAFLIDDGHGAPTLRHVHQHIT